MAREITMTWKLNIEINSSSFEALLWGISDVMKWIARNKVPMVKDLTQAQSFTNGGGDSYNWTMKCESPIKEQIKVLRAEADRLEMELEGDIELEKWRENP